MARSGRSVAMPVGFRHGVDRRADNRVIDRLRHALAHEEHVHAPAAQRVDVVVRRDDPMSEVGPERFHVKHRIVLLYPEAPTAPSAVPHFAVSPTPSLAQPAEIFVDLTEPRPVCEQPVHRQAPGSKRYTAADRARERTFRRSFPAFFGGNWRPARSRRQRPCFRTGRMTHTARFSISVPSLSP